ncbi:hypothetical protein NQ317_002091 [Molorchus minor]|uniref:Uncharacterized protein n=1 Tax=Molorchus minor TaxID=1323400 RepID=A0ABQ9JPL4_9CUCU|nr:hypothetical protein NQ317_002091 [Molorchus minor]
MLETPSVNKPDSQSLRLFVTNIKQNLNSLKALKQPIESWDIILVYLFSKKLDYQTQRAFELEKSSLELPTLNKFFEFLEKRCTAFENLSVRETNSKVTPRHLGIQHNSVLLQDAEYVTVSITHYFI